MIRSRAHRATAQAGGPVESNGQTKAGFGHNGVSEVSGGRAWRQCHKAQKARMMCTSGFSPARLRAFGNEGRDDGGAMGWTGVMPLILTCGVRLIKAVNGNLYIAPG
ncbi:hypothetical protein B8W72_13480 [Pseudomonas putida]|uniref:Uncharacterized protein n=1 Tax=Pseudomonas putida TaxID=303 RepID=A0A1Y3L395_PSEPU|nr:hypothetical protein B8W72_13480 [Pseudomonas putida]